MQKSHSNFLLIRTSTKFLDFTRGRQDLLKERKHQGKQVLPPITRQPKSKPSQRCVQFNLGTMSIINQAALRNRKKKFLLKNSLTNTTRNRLKLKTIHWILSHYREEIDRLLDNCKILLMQTSYKGDMNYSTFEDIMISLGVGSDKTLVDRLFWVFDEDGNGKIDIKEAVVGLEMFRETNFKEKLEMFFDICDEDGSGDIDEEEFFNVLKLCVSSEKERKILKEILHELFIAIDEDGNGVLTKEEIIKAATNSEAMKSIIENSIMVCQGVDSWIASDFYAGPNANFTTASVARTNGVSHTDINRLLDAFKEEEAQYEKDSIRNAENKRKVLTWMRANGHSDLNLDIDQKELIIGADGNPIHY